MIDLDDISGINDRYGHGVGDEVLRQVARRVQRAGPGRRHGGATGRRPVRRADRVDGVGPRSARPRRPSDDDDQQTGQRLRSHGARSPRASEPRPAWTAARMLRRSCWKATPPCDGRRPQAAVGSKSSTTGCDPSWPIGAPSRRSCGAALEAGELEIHFSPWWSCPAQCSTATRPRVRWNRSGGEPWICTTSCPAPCPPSWSSTSIAGSSQRPPLDLPP